MLLHTRSTLMNRRRIIGAMMASGALLTERGLFADELATGSLTPTSSLGEGPFYPDRLPLDTDNDLLVINDSITPAVGSITHLSGRVLGFDGRPIRGALVEIWQVDAKGVYLHTRSNGREKRDANFQGYGRFLTDRKGRYYFRTVKPVPYPGRTPHIHFAISRNGKRVLTTQMLESGNPQNSRDGLFRRLRTKQEQQTLLAQFQPVQGSPVGELSAQFDLVLGQTATDAPS